MSDLVLIHGFMQDGAVWADAAERLAPIARVHTPDLPGFGLRANGPLPRSIDDLADGIERYLREHELRDFVLAALSMGGYATFAWWRKYGRERPPRGIALIDTVAVADSESMRRKRNRLIAIVQTGGTNAAVGIVEPTLWISHAPPGFREPHKAIMRRQRPEAIIAGLEIMRDRPDSTSTVPTITVPTLVFGGTEDTITPYPDMEAMAEALPRCEAVWIEGAGHLACFEQPATFDAAIRAFLSSIDQ